MRLSCSVGHGRNLLWVLGSIGRARYRVTMTTPGGKRVKSRHTVLIVCSPERKADPHFGCSIPPAR